MSDPTLDLENLTSDQKLRILEKVWDSLIADPDAVPLPGWQRRELDRRLDEIDRGDTSGIPWDRVLSEIEGRAR